MRCGFGQWYRCKLKIGQGSSLFLKGCISRRRDTYGTPVKNRSLGLVFFIAVVADVAEVAEVVPVIGWIRNGWWSSEAFPVVNWWISLVEDSRQSLWSPASRGGADQKIKAGAMLLLLLLWNVDYSWCGWTNKRIVYYTLIPCQLVETRLLIW